MALLSNDLSMPPDAGVLYSSVDLGSGLSEVIFRDVSPISESLVSRFARLSVKRGCTIFLTSHGAGRIFFIMNQLGPAFTLSSLLLAVGSASGANILSPGDAIIAIGSVGSGSNHPGLESPANILDGDPNTKYLNFAEERSGFIVTPGGLTTASSIVFTTANDAPERDPTSFSIWGTNDSIRSTNNSLGDQENWTPILTNTALSLPTARLTAGAPVDLFNSVAFSSYRVTFDTVRNEALANSMQIADVQMFTDTGAPILSSGMSILAIDLDDSVATSSFPPGENPSLAIDGDPSTKYLNFGGDQTGFIVTPGVGASIVDGFTITTANDAPDRDPVGYTLFGTNDAITSAENSGGTDENWVVIQSGTLTPPSERFTEYGVSIDGNNTSYTSYRFDVDTVGGSPLMQIGEIQFEGRLIPEPSSAVLMALGLLPMLRRRR